MTLHLAACASPSATSRDFSAHERSSRSALASLCASEAMICGGGECESPCKRNAKRLRKITLYASICDLNPQPSTLKSTLYASICDSAVAQMVARPSCASRSLVSSLLASSNSLKARLETSLLASHSLLRCSTSFLSSPVSRSCAPLTLFSSLSVHFDSCKQPQSQRANPLQNCRSPKSKLPGFKITQPQVGSGCRHGALLLAPNRTPHTAVKLQSTQPYINLPKHTALCL